MRPGRDQPGLSFCQDGCRRALASPCSGDVRRHTEAEAAIRAVFEQRSEFAAAVEQRRRFPGIGDTAKARECARNIAGRKLPVALLLRPVRLPKVPRLRRCADGGRLPMADTVRTARLVAGA